ncbi:hypothetical protein CcaverHIS641_0308020 [Cutaneotrichosporon cavernicola]|nr:hypothetical protein CcaverHIS641_0308020 [Cutaneotrichosporon cavernicola]
MSDNRPIPSEVGSSSSPSRAIASVTSGTPRLAQIPPRNGAAGSFQAARSVGRDSGIQRTATPPPGSDTDLGTKAPVAEPSQPKSALTAALGKSSTGKDAASTPDHASGSATPANPDESAFSNLAEVPDEEKARVLRRHLVSAEERGGGSKVATPGQDATPVEDSSQAGDSSVVQAPEESFPIPYDAPGGDVTHSLYKWQQGARPRRPSRAASFSHADRSGIIDPAVTQMKEPGGFRRNFLSARAQERGDEVPPMIRNVVDFLFLYGHFAGEDLDEDEDVDDDDELAEAEEGMDGSAARAGPASERTPLLQRTMSKNRRRSKSVHNQGTASVTQAVLMLLKGFVGTGVLFMGKAFYNGGILFSTVVLLAIGAISLWSFLLLVQTWMKVPGSFGDIGGQLYGNWLRITILFSITVSQIGFVAAYTIFIAENLRAFFLAVTDCKLDIPTSALIFAQLFLFLPLAMIRNLAKLSGTALVADAFILIGLIYIASSEIGTIVEKGVAPDVVLFNPDHFPLLIGTAVFAFEGVGLVIPITETMKEPQKFSRALSGVLLFVAVLFSTFGVLGYAAYGSEVQTVVLVNLPQQEKFVQVSQFLYSIAILLSIPLQLFPAVRIMETGLFSRSGKHNRRVKWQKNVFRAGTVIFCSLLSWAGSSELDKFVSLVGAFACLPLCFIYPPMLHLRGCATTRTAKALDYLLLAFGIVVGVYSTVQTLRSLFAPSNGDSPTFGKSFTISSEALARFPAAIQRTIVDVVQSELEKARSNCIQVLASPPRAEPASAQEPRAPMDEAWQREATRFVHSIEGFLNSCPSVKRGPNFKANSKHILEDAFRRSQFLNKAECRIVAKAAGLSSQQVRTWFQNKRNRSSKKPSKATGEAQLWFEDVVGRPGSPSLHTPTADWDWSKIHQSLWLQYAGPSAGVMWDPPQVQGDSWLPRDTAALAMAASNFIDFQEPATESK